MNDFSFFIYFKERILPILSVVLVIFAIWYIFTVYLNSSKQIDKYERQKINWDFSDLVRDLDFHHFFIGLENQKALKFHGLKRW